MSDPITVLALRRKRDEISAVIAEYENKIKAAQHDLGHVVASLRLFELTGDPSEFPAYIDLKRLLRRGETTRICMMALVKEGPLDTRELTKRVMTAKGLNEDDKVKRMKKHGLVETKASVTNKLARGTFPISFFLAALAALELDGVRLEDV